MDGSFLDGLLDRRSLPVPRPRALSSFLQRAQSVSAQLPSSPQKAFIEYCRRPG
jgi:hypothetical protein